VLVGGRRSLLARRTESMFGRDLGAAAAGRLHARMEPWFSYAQAQPGREEEYTIWKVSRSGRASETGYGVEE
jgi:hypothetical protein